MYTPFRSVAERWEDLCDALAGLFYASICSLNDMRMTTPSHFFCLEGFLPFFHPDMTQYHWPRHTSPPSSTSPHAFPQSHHFMPFLKQPSCKATTGTAALLNLHRRAMVLDESPCDLGLHNKKGLPEAQHSNCVRLRETLSITPAR